MRVCVAVSGVGYRGKGNFEDKVLLRSRGPWGEYDDGVRGANHSNEEKLSARSEVLRDVLPRCVRRKQVSSAGDFRDSCGTLTNVHVSNLLFVWNKPQVHVSHLPFVWQESKVHVSHLPFMQHES